MSDQVWRAAFVALWFVLVVAGMWLLKPVFMTVCDDCIGSYPGFFGYGGVVIDWSSVVIWSVLNATLVTGLLWFGSRGLRRRPDSEGLAG